MDSYESGTIAAAFNYLLMSTDVSIVGKIKYPDGEIEFLEHFERPGELIAFVLNNTPEDFAERMHPRGQLQRFHALGHDEYRAAVEETFLSYVNEQLDKPFCMALKGVADDVLTATAETEEYTLAERLWAFHMAHGAEYDLLAEYSLRIGTTARYHHLSALSNAGMEEEEAWKEEDAFNAAVKYGQRNGFDSKYYLGLIHKGECTTEKSYLEGSLRDLLIHELNLMLDREIVMKRCAICGKYFIPSNRSDQLYCDYINEEYAAQGKEWTCRQIAIRLNEQKSYSGNEARRRYKSIYNMLLNKHGVRSKELAQFTNKASELKRQMKDGTIEESTYMDWLNGHYKKAPARKDEQNGEH